MGDHLYIKRLVTGPIETNTYLLGCACTGKAAVIDPGGDAETILRELDFGEWQLTAIINTHGHFDHIAANGALAAATGAQILIHSADAVMLTDPRANLSVYMGGQPIVSPPADRLLVEGDEVRVGELLLTVWATPGHSPGGICLWLPEVVWTGDTLFAGSAGRTDFPGADARLLTQSLGRLQDLPDTVRLLPGHGPETTVARERRLNPFFKVNPRL